MLRSMTGFSSRVLVLTLEDGTKVNVSTSLKSLNSRFFEVTCKLPYVLTQFETTLTKLFKKKLHRGHLYFTIHMSNPSVFKGAVEPSVSVIKSYVDAINIAKEKFDISGEVTVSNLLQLPNIFNIEEKGVDEESKKVIFATIDTLIEELIEAQEQEGVSLRQDVEKRVETMTHEIKKIEAASHQLMERQKEKIATLLQEIEQEPGELADARRNALLYTLDKMDINEEIVRFKSHVGTINSILSAATDEKGKRLDFTLQELAREINTIAAKCSDATIGSLAINVKVELEKAREQAQNIV